MLFVIYQKCMSTVQLVHYPNYVGGRIFTLLIKGMGVGWNRKQTMYSHLNKEWIQFNEREICACQMDINQISPKQLEEITTSSLFEELWLPYLHRAAPSNCIQRTYKSYLKTISRIEQVFQRFVLHHPVLWKSWQHGEKNIYCYYSSVLCLCF